MSDHHEDKSNKPVMIPSSNTSIQNVNWSGSLPILLSLAPTSLSSPTAPRPIHKLISRVSYLHVALHEEVMQLSECAPVGLLSSAMTGLSVEEPPDDDDPAKAEGDGEEDISSSAKKESADDANNQTDKKMSDSAAHSQSKAKAKAKEINNKQKNNAYPECWFEDEASGVPLRWHLFVGVLYDLMKGKALLLYRSSSWSRGRGSGGTPSTSTQTDQHNFLPWRIRVHFTSYPDQLLPLDDGSPQLTKSDNTNSTEDDSRNRIAAMARRIFSNSLKQALFLQYGSSKVAMSITKSSHEKLWDAVLRSNYGLYHEVNVELQSGIMEGAISSSQSSSADTMIVKEERAEIPQLIPIRVMYNGMPAIQKPTKHIKESEGKDCKERPAEILAKMGTYQAPPYTTLADVLADYFPHHFAVDPSSGCANDISDSSVYYCIQGVQPTTKCAVVDLWRALSHPDHFLYITVITS